MAREWIDPASGTQILEDGTKTYIHPTAGAQIQEDQAAPVVGDAIIGVPIQNINIIIGKDKIIGY